MLISCSVDRDYARDTYDTIKSLEDEGLLFGRYGLGYSGRFIYIKSIDNNVKYGYDIKRDVVGIKYKVRF